MFFFDTILSKLILHDRPSSDRNRCMQWSVVDTSAVKFRRRRQSELHKAALASRHQKKVRRAAELAELFWRHRRHRKVCDASFTNIIYVKKVYHQNLKKR